MSAIEPGPSLEEPPPRRPSLVRSTAVMSLGTIISRLTGIGRFVVFAALFGANEFAGTYSLANQTPTALYELVVGGILAATLVPVFARLFAEKDPKEDPWHAVSAVLTVVGVAVVGLTVLLWLAAPWIIDLTSSLNDQPTIGDQKDVAVFLLRLFVPQIAFYGFISVATALLNTKRRFGPPMFAPIFNNLVLICLFLAASRLIDDTSIAAIADDRGALWLMGLGTTAGVMTMALVLVPFVRAESRGRLHFVWAPRHPVVKTLVGLSGWTMGFVLANQAAYWLSVVLAYSNAGDPAAYQYAYTFFILPHGIYAVSVMTSLQPGLSEFWAARDVDRFRRQVVTGLRLIMFLIVPGAVGYALLVHPIVTVLLQRGSFDDNDTDVTSSLLFWMVVGLPGFSAFIYLTRAFQAMQRAKTVFFLYVFENGVNIVAALALYPSMGVSGVGLGQSLGYAAGAIAAALTLRRHAGGLDGRRLVSGLLRITGASILMGLVVYGIDQILPGAPLAGLLASILAGAVVFAVAAWLFRIEELRSVVRFRRAA